MSRNTILTVYEQLLAEGYVVSRRGSGTFVAKTLPDMFLPTSSASESSPAPAASAPISRRGQHLLGLACAMPGRHLDPGQDRSIAGLGVLGLVVRRRKA